MRLRSHVAGVLGVISLTSLGRAQLSAPQAAHAWRIAHEQTILREFTDLIALPNVSSDTANIHRNADALVAALERRQVAATLLQVPGANPVVFGNITTPGARRTIVFYAHYDGQPVTPEDWDNENAVRAGSEGGERSDPSSSAARQRMIRPRLSHNSRHSNATAGSTYPAQSEPAIRMGGRGGGRLDAPAGRAPEISRRARRRRVAHL